MLPMPWSVFPVPKVDKLRMPWRCQPVNQAVPNVFFSLPLSSGEVKEMSLCDDNGYKFHFKNIFSLKKKK
jgi:hypothetical protein